jgi:predicted nucleic acid-binding Zn ribbon protein
MGYLARPRALPRPRQQGRPKEAMMNTIIYIVGLLVVVMAVLSLLGLR